MQNTNAKMSTIVFHAKTWWCTIRKLACFVLNLFWKCENMLSLCDHFTIIIFLFQHVIIISSPNVFHLKDYKSTYTKSAHFNCSEYTMFIE